MKSGALILGGGLAGLSAAFHLKRPCVILERNKDPGGLVATVRYGEFLFDVAPHVFFTDDDYALSLFVHLVGESHVLVHDQNSRVYLNGVLSRFPIQASLYGQPPEVVADCLDGLADALHSPNIAVPTDFRQWVLGFFGWGIGKHFLFPYNTKLWGAQPEELSPDWTDGKIVKVSFREAVIGAVSDRSLERYANKTFRYPATGGISTLPRAFAAQLTGLRPKTEVVEIDLHRKEARTAAGEAFSYEAAVWTLPLHLVGTLVRDLPNDVLDAARALRYRRVVCVFVGLDRPLAEPWHWTYFSEEKYPFYRVSFPHAFSPAMVPRDKASMCAEVSIPSGGVPDLETIKESVLAGMERATLLHQGERPCLVETAIMDPAYVVHDHKRDAAVRGVTDYLQKCQVFPAGRFGEWAFINMDQTILSGRQAADQVNGVLG
ncbi:MAG TPA: FAD-dependent oxidoreductase [Spirochaetia bacterium]|nr:FAD-dependent oxidoreductase [Spirochaetia bacterium]